MEKNEYFQMMDKDESILYQFKDDKNVFKYIGIATVLIFGVVHIIGSDITSFISLATAILKVLSAGLIGLTFMFMFWKKKNILGCVLTHAFYDFFSAISIKYFAFILLYFFIYSLLVLTA